MLHYRTMIVPLHHVHAAFEPDRSRLLHLAVDVDHGRTVDEQHVAVAQHRVLAAGLVAVEGGQVDVRAIPCFRLAGGIYASTESIPVRCIGRLCRALMLLISLRTFDVVDITVGQATLR